jgi:hypothetical protein
MLNRRLFALLGALAICVVAIFYFARGGPVPDSPPPTAEEVPPVPEAPPAPARPAPAPPAHRADERANEGIPIMPASPDARMPEGPVHPHPITAEHLRIFAENQLVGNLDGAMEVKDVAGMRRLLERYRREYPEDGQILQDGYAVIADCLEHPGGAARAAAQRWIEGHNGSILKRFVNRHCLEPQQP